MISSLPLQSVTQMARRLTTPFGRGADTLQLALLPQGSGTTAAFAGYDFAEHRALFDRPAEPRYVVAALTDVASDTVVTIDYTATPGGPAQPPIELVVPAGTLAGASFLVDLGAHEGEGARLTRLTMSPAAPGGEAAKAWRVAALLGTTAKLLWVLGWERDHLRRQIKRTVRQRQLTNALGLSLDLIGYDLGIPRFPPLPYSFDEPTVALYHLDDPSLSTTAEDVMGRYPGRTGHTGTVTGAVQPAVTGRFGSGFAFSGANAAVVIPPHGDFDLGAGDSFTVECFVRPVKGAPEGRLLSKHPDPATGQAGWALSVGEFGRGLPLNPRWLASDGANPPVAVFADRSLSTERFTHLAGVVDRTSGTASLYVDGALAAQAPLGALQSVANGEPVLIGHGGAALQGVVDEVRISRTARRDFFPALGERDDNYRERLRFFRRWVLPTPANLLALLNEGIGAVNGDQAPLVLNDVTTTIVGGVATVTVDPVQLLPGVTMDSAGRRRVTEAGVCGSAADEPLFDPAFLVTHSDPRVAYQPAPTRVLGPNEPPPDSHKMQLAVARAVNALLDLAAPEGAGGKLIVRSAFDPRVGDLRRTGRGILFTHEKIDTGRLAALAHRSGFDFVSCSGVPGGVYASCVLREYLEIVATPAANFTGMDGAVGDALHLAVNPPPPAHSTYRWIAIPCGKGEAAIVTFPGDGSTATVQVTAPGELTVKVDVAVRGATVSATRVLRLGIHDLPNLATIGSDGTPAVTEAVAGSPDPFFSTAFLVKHQDARASYGADPNTHLMQASVAAPLTRLLDLITAGGSGGTLFVDSAFDPASTGLAGVGRALTLRHSVLTGGQLSPLAFAAGFTFVARQDPAVLVRQGAGDLVSVAGPRRVDEGEKVTLASGVHPGDVGAAVRLQWTVGGAGEAQARLSSTTLPTVQLEGVRAGEVRVQALYLVGDNPAPYTFEVRLKPALEAAGAVIRKEQYDLVMNILNAFHPAGVEVITTALRDHVVELQGSLLAANPDYTYPRYRVRGPAPRQRKE